MADQGIAMEKKGPLALVTLRRPDRLNAFNRAMFDRLAQVVGELSTPPLPRAVIVTGEGPDAFCAGFDVNPDNPMVAEMARALERGEKGPIERAVGALRSAVDRFVFPPHRGTFEIRPAALGEEVVLHGAMAMAGEIGAIE